MARAKKKQAEQSVEQIAEEIQTVSDEIVSDEDLGIGEMIEEEVVAVEAAAETPAEDAVELIMSLEDVRLVEAILFATSSALTVGMISERFPVERAAIIPDVLEHLKEMYANRGVTLVQRDSRWAFRTATDLASNLRLEKEQPKKFTRSAMETMAVVAYHQPVTRAEIENIRGVATSPGALDALMEAGWIKPGKRREVPGRPVTWLSTQGFLDHFGLEKLEDLPGMDELKAAGLLDKRPAIEAMPTADMFDENENQTEEDLAEVTDEDLIGQAVADGGSAETLDDEDMDDEDAEESADEDDEGDEGDDDEDLDDDDEDSEEASDDDEEEDDEDLDDDDDEEDDDDADDESGDDGDDGDDEE